MNEDEETRRRYRNYSLWKLHCKLHNLQSQRPLIFNFYYANSGDWFLSLTEQLPLDYLKDPNNQKKTSPINCVVFPQLQK